MCFQFLNKQDKKIEEMNLFILIICVLHLSLVNSIINGDDCTIEQKPWNVALEMGLWPRRCGGVILDKRFIATAAHCIEDFEYFWVTVKVGNSKGDVIHVFKTQVSFQKKQVSMFLKVYKSRI